MRDFSHFVDGQCEIQSHLSEREDRRTCKGEIKSIRVADTEIEVRFNWLAHWSLKDGFWTMDNSPPERLYTKTGVKDPSMICAKDPTPDGIVLVDIHTKGQLLLLYAKDYKGAPKLLSRVKVEEHQARRAELEILLQRQGVR